MNLELGCKHKLIKPCIYKCKNMQLYALKFIDNYIKIYLSKVKYYFIFKILVYTLYTFRYTSI